MRETAIEKEKPLGRFFLPSLVISSFPVIAPNVVVGLLLIDIASAFGTDISVMGQIRTASAILRIITCLLMGFLSVRFSHKSLVILGLVFFCISAFGSGFASSFIMMLIVFSLSGVGFGIVRPMVSAMGGRFPVEKRPGAVAWLTVGRVVAMIIGAPIVLFLVGYGGWRSAFLGFVLVLSFLSLIFALKGLPSNQHSVRRGSNFLDGFKQILSNRSAIASLLGVVVAIASSIAIQFYWQSYFRQRFLLSIALVAPLSPVTAVCAIVGILLGGRLVNRFGRKKITTFGNLIMGLFIISFFNLPLLWLSLVFLCVGAIFMGIRWTASESLVLEQVPDYRGTMMSLNTVADAMGASIGNAVGGMLLLRYNWETFGIVLGVFGIVSSLIIYLLVSDSI